MRISVIVPSYNEEMYLPRCLIALKNQTRAPFEIIVIDNNSTDDTYNVAKSYGITVVKEPIQGLTHARQRGYKEARGEIVARIDADCVPDIHWVEGITKMFSTNEKIDAVTGPLLYTDISTVGTMIFRTEIYRFVSSILLIHPILFGPNSAIKKNVVLSLSPHLDDAVVHEDIDLSCHLIASGKTIAYDPQMIVYTSARRIFGNPRSFFLEYPKRYIQTIRHNHTHIFGPHKKNLTY